MSKKINLLVISNMYPRGNSPISGIFIHRQNRELVRMGVEIRVISPVPFVPRLAQTNPKRRGYRDLPLSVILDGIPVYYPRCLATPLKFLYGVSAYFFSSVVLSFAKQLVEEFRFDIIHTHCVTPDGYAGLILRKKFNVPAVCSVRGSDVNTCPFYKPVTMHLSKRVIAKTDQMVCVSNSLKKNVVKLAQPANDILVIPNGVDLERFVFSPQARDDIRRQLNISPDSKVLIFIGALKREKGVRELIVSFAELAGQYHNLHLIMVGDGPARTLINKFSRADLPGKNLHLTGLVSHSQVPGFLSAGDIFVLPTYSEGFPNAVKEAMACSRPVVATKVGGIPEVVENEKTGFLVEAGDSVSLTRAIKTLLENQALCVEMGAHGRLTMERGFSWEASGLKYMDVYQRLLENWEAKSKYA